MLWRKLGIPNTRTHTRIYKALYNLKCGKLYLNLLTQQNMATFFHFCCNIQIVHTRRVATEMIIWVQKIGRGLWGPHKAPDGSRVTGEGIHSFLSPFYFNSYLFFLKLFIYLFFCVKTTWLHVHPCLCVATPLLYLSLCSLSKVNLTNDNAT